MGKQMKRVFFNVYVAANMLLCSVVFAPWALPRETFSGFLGRMVLRGSDLQLRLVTPAVWVIDWLYFWEANHCVTVAREEAQARAALYPSCWQ